MRDRDAQYKHELKKKQREINKLMERLHQLLMDKNPDRRIGIVFLSRVQPVLNKPCIKQAPVLSKHFHFPPIDFTCK